MTLKFGNLTLDKHTHILQAPRGDVRLPRNDFFVMAALIQRGDKIATMGDIITTVWSYPCQEPEHAEHAVRCSIKNLRGFLSLAALGRHSIRCERDCGYYLTDARPHTLNTKEGML